MSTDDQSELLELLIDVDNRAVGLNSEQIEFVADLIDNDVTEFTPSQAKAIRFLHRKFVKDDQDELD